jgi:hypothetical protein
MCGFIYTNLEIKRLEPVKSSHQKRDVQKVGLGVTVICSAFHFFLLGITEWVTTFGDSALLPFSDDPNSGCANRNLWFYFVTLMVPFGKINKRITKKLNWTW